MTLRLIFCSMIFWCCSNPIPEPKKGVFMTRVPEKDIIEKCGYVNDTFQLHYTAVEFENYAFDTIYFDICKRYQCASYQALLYDFVHFFNNNKQWSGSGTGGPSCKDPLNTIKLSKGNKTTIFVEMPDFDMSRDSNEIFWGQGAITWLTITKLK